VTGACIVRWEASGTVVLAVHGAFDGASAWALRVAMDESPAREFVVDLAHSEEAFEFAAAILSSWARQWSRVKRVTFRAASAEHARILAAHGLEGDEEPVDGAAPAPPGRALAGEADPA
jgi:STAS domain-containing protein